MPRGKRNYTPEQLEAIEAWKKRCDFFLAHKDDPGHTHAFGDLRHPVGRKSIPWEEMTPQRKLKILNERANRTKRRGLPHGGLTKEEKHERYLLRMETGWYDREKKKFDKKQKALKERKKGNVSKRGKRILIPKDPAYQTPEMKAGALPGEKIIEEL